jgi:hypothetical protein
MPELKGKLVTAIPRRNRRYKKGRICKFDGCTTVLSIYNRSEYCWLHKPARPILLGR